MDEVNSGSSVDFTIYFTHPSGNPVTPTNLSYVVLDFFSDTVVVESTTNVPPEGATSMDIPLGPDANANINQYYNYEMRVVQFTYDYNASDVKIEEYTYKVINMHPVPEGEAS